MTGMIPPTRGACPPMVFPNPLGMEFLVDSRVHHRPVESYAPERCSRVPRGDDRALNGVDTSINQALCDAQTLGQWKFAQQHGENRSQGPTGKPQPRLIPAPTDRGTKFVAARAQTPRSNRGGPSVRE
jgi:hypothetical protein